MHNVKFKMHNEKLRKFKTPAALPAFVLFCVLCLLQCALPDAFAEKPREEYNRIQRTLKSHTKKLASVKRVEQTVLVELKKTNAELAGLERQLSRQRDKIKKLQSNLAALQEDVKYDSAALQTHRGRLRKRLRILLTFNIDRDAALILLSGDDISQSLRVIRYLRDISAHDFGLITKYKEELQVLAAKEMGLRKLSADLKTEEKQLSKLEADLKDKKKEREVLLANVRKEKSIYENMIKDLKESSSRLRRIIQESERHEKELRRKKRTKTRPGAKGDDFYEDSEFLRMKGRLHWPVTGSVAIQYGTQVDPLFNLPVFRSGIHIKAGSGLPVRAVYGGKVVFADDFKGYGQLVIISHGSGYHTLYGNLAKIFSKNGAIIRENQAIGAVGESGILGTSGLYFEIRYKGKPLDPRQWLTKR